MTNRSHVCSFKREYRTLAHIFAQAMGYQKLLCVFFRLFITVNVNLSNLRRELRNAVNNYIFCLLMTKKPELQNEKPTSRRSNATPTLRWCSIANCGRNGSKGHSRFDLHLYPRPTIDKLDEYGDETNLAGHTSRIIPKSRASRSAQ